MIAEIVGILPENDWLRFTFLTLLVLVGFLKEKPFVVIWKTVRYLYRWTRCRFGKHTWDAMVVAYCVICLKTEHEIDRRV